MPAAALVPRRALIASPDNLGPTILQGSASQIHHDRLVGPIGDNASLLIRAPSPPPLRARQNLNRHPRHVLKHARKDVLPRPTLKLYKGPKTPLTTIALLSAFNCENK